jgi:hypothetical protein
MDQFFHVGLHHHLFFILLHRVAPRIIVVAASGVIVVATRILSTLDYTPDVVARTSHRQELWQALLPLGVITTATSGMSPCWAASDALPC